MKYYQITLILLVALIHCYIVYIEMVLWTTKKGIKTFGLKDKQFAEKTKVMAANQGLYNGFLVAGLIWAIITFKIDVAIFFLTCVFIAGLYGAYSTKNRKILYVQSIPAILGIISLLVF
ncbi:DUF1304 domain-containing protein [Polaribacter vadi]|uniref:DUF1304 domain-containing protein n=1 Tax=Polaribacter TaxID=52959 RepID=UPI001C085559|nr:MULTISPECIES: DUF1304 domain-containing protein [Polaribacter]MBU3010479.1 DUF1304 domain-containing protein [Polaribacter vadi]MDO6740287.1 DUF1304 domain-containing protein [Polaribacter sp. 1_MG-2023]